MLHFRRSALLKELFRTGLKRTTPPPRLPVLCRVADASSNAGAASRVKVFHAGVPRPVLSPRPQPPWAARSYCTKSDEQVTAKDDGEEVTPGATAADKCVVFKLIRLVVNPTCR